jgi:hypothetical protein
MHSRRAGAVPRHSRANSHLNVRRRLVNSLLEHLRRRLRELARPLDEMHSLDGARQASRIHAGDAPQRRTEIETPHRPQASDRTIRGNEASLPAQQPPPPASTRLKTAVFSKRRQPGPPRQAGTIWGPTSFLDMGTSASGDDKGARSPLELLNSAPMVTSPGLTPDVMSWPSRPSPAPSHPFEAGVDTTRASAWTSGQCQAPADVSYAPSPSLDGASPLHGAPALGPNSESSRHALPPEDKVLGAVHSGRD